MTKKTYSSPFHRVTSERTAYLLPDLIELQRKSFYDFLEKGLLEEFSKINPVTLNTGEISVVFYPKDYQFTPPPFTLREAILQGKTYSAKFYVPARICCSKLALPLESFEMTNQSFSNKDKQLGKEKRSKNKENKGSQRDLSPRSPHSRLDLASHLPIKGVGRPPVPPELAHGGSKDTHTSCGLGLTSKEVRGGKANEEVRPSNPFTLRAQAKPPLGVRVARPPGSSLRGKFSEGVPALALSPGSMLKSQSALLLQAFGKDSNEDKTVKIWSLKCWVLVGNIPLMTKRGHFVINGSPRVIVSQMIRCPGVYFHERFRGVGIQKKRTCYIDFISRRGAWLRIQSDKNRDLWVRLKRTPRIPLDVFQEGLKSFERLWLTGLTAGETSVSQSFQRSATAYKIGEEAHGNSLSMNKAIKTLFHNPLNSHNKGFVEKLLMPSKRVFLNSGNGERFSLRSVYPPALQNKISFSEPGKERLHVKTYPWQENGKSQSVKEFYRQERVDSLREKREFSNSAQLQKNDLTKTVSPSSGSWCLPKGLQTSINNSYDRSRFSDLFDEVQENGSKVESTTSQHVENGKSEEQAANGGFQFVFQKFKNPRTYDLGKLGRDRINSKLKSSTSSRQLSSKDIEFACYYLKKIERNQILPDDIDNLKNRRVRASGELLQGQLETGFYRLERFILSRLKPALETLRSVPWVYPLQEKIVTHKSTKASKRSAKSLSLAKNEKTSGPIAQKIQNLGIRRPPPLTSLEVRPKGVGVAIEPPSKEGIPVAGLGGDQRTLNGKLPLLENAGRKTKNKQNSASDVTSSHLFKILRSVITTKALNGALREFFGSNPLSQYMDQTNPLAEVTHKRRLSSLGPGGISRDTAGMAIRGIHSTHYGRICPIETPEGKNAGLVNSLTVFAKATSTGFLETPYYKVFKGQVQTGCIHPTPFFLSADSEQTLGTAIAPGDLNLSASRFLPPFSLPARIAGTFEDPFKRVNREKINCIALSPLQMISIATSLIPFLEHDDANRALMGSNMQRQAVPLLRPERPIVGTGLESLVVAESGQTLESESVGLVIYSSSEKILLHRLDSFPLSLHSVVSLPRQKWNPFLSPVTLPLPLLSIPLCGLRKARLARDLTTSWVGHDHNSSVSLLGRALHFSEPRGSKATHTSCGLGLTSKEVRWGTGNSLDTGSYRMGGQPLVGLRTSVKARGLGLELTSPEVRGGCPLRGMATPGHRGGEQPGPKRIYSKFPFTKTYPLFAFQRSNQETCLSHRPAVREGDWVQKGDLLADCSASSKGELALGKNILIAYIPWEGYNFEDAVVASERLAKEDLYTSVHIEKHEVEIRESRLGLEEIGLEIPHITKKQRKSLDANGLIKVGTWVNQGDILVAKTTAIKPKPLSPHQKLAFDLARLKPSRTKDTSLRVPKGVHGRVIGVEVLESASAPSSSALPPQPKGERLPKANALKAVSVSVGETEAFPVLEVNEKRKSKEAKKSSDKNLRANKSKNQNGLKVGKSPVQMKSDAGVNAQGLIKLMHSKDRVINSPNLNIGSMAKKPTSKKRFVPLFLHFSTIGFIPQTYSRFAFILSPATALPFSLTSTWEIKAIYPLVAFNSKTINSKNDEITQPLVPSKKESMSSLNVYAMRNPFLFFLWKGSKSWNVLGFIKKQVVDKDTIGEDEVKQFSYWFAFTKVISSLRHGKSSFEKGPGEMAGLEVIKKFVMDWKHSLHNRLRASLLTPFYSFDLPESQRAHEWNSFFSSLKKRNPTLLPGAQFKSFFFSETPVSATSKDESLIPKDSGELKDKDLMQKPKALHRLFNVGDESLQRKTVGTPKKVNRDNANLATVSPWKKVPTRVRVYIAEKRKIQVGDKVAGRHGNKGIVSVLLPRIDMPYLPDGSIVDMILNPLGVPSRMNVGQVFECLLGLAGVSLNQHYRIPPFDEMYGAEASRSLVYLKLYQARLRNGQHWLFHPLSPGKTRLTDGRTGEPFDQLVTVGTAYIIKLVHLVDEKIHARSTGPYSLVTKQPLGGRSKHGGQRLGEMEVWALEGFGAAYILQEMLTSKSDDVLGRQEVLKGILSKRSNPLGNPEAFKVLVRELQSLCLDIRVSVLKGSPMRRERVDISQIP